MSSWLTRLAGAPISWGVCEVPGWGHQLPVHLVLTKMAAVGLRAAEFGPDGFLPDDGGERSATLGQHGLAAVGGFVPVVTHRADLDPVVRLAPLLDGFAATGAGTVVFAAVSGAGGYDGRTELTGPGWDLLCANLDALAADAAARGLTAALHPHLGTLVEGPEEVDRVLAGSSIGLCLDTGHLLAGGTDPLELTRRAAERIVHVHLKDVDLVTVARVRTGELRYADAVAAGMYRPLGSGDAGIGELVRTLEDAGYAGWYVLEQDRILPVPPDAAHAADADAVAAAEIRTDVQTSLDHLHAVVRA